MNHDEKNAPTVVEDLTVNEDQANGVKGGPSTDYFLHVQGIEGDSDGRSRAAPAISEIVVTKQMDGI